MLRLELMPLVSDFGESLNHPLKQVNPRTRVMFTRDYRLFGQFSNFPDTPKEKPTCIIQTFPLPEGLTVGVASEEDGVTFSRRDESGEINWTYAKEIKKLSLPANTSNINKAIKAYVDKLPDNMPVLLRWD